MGDPEIMRIMQGLLQIPTVISTGGSTGEDLIIAQAVRQNVKASMQLPMHAMEWAGMVLSSCKLTLGTSVEQTQQILLCLARCTAKYDASLEVNTYDVQPVAKRARRGRRKSAAATAAAVSEPKHPEDCLLYTSPSPRDLSTSRMPSSA